MYKTNIPNLSRIKNHKLFLIIIISAIVLFAVFLLITSLRSTPLDTYTILPRDIKETLVTTGRTTSTASLQMAFEVAGTIQDIHYKEGSKIKSGDLFISLNSDLESTNLALLQKQLNSAYLRAQEKVMQYRLKANQMKDTYVRLLALAEAGAVSQTELEESKNATVLADSDLKLAKLDLQETLIDIDDHTSDLSEISLAELQIRQAQINLEKRQLHSPINGRILSIEKQPGEYILPGTIVAILGTDVPLIEMEIDEKQYVNLKLGQSVLISPQAEPNQIFEGEITSIAAKVDATKGTLNVTCSLIKDTAFLKPDSAVNAEIILSQANQVLTIPKDFIIIENNSYHVLLWKNNKALKTSIQVIKPLNDWYIIEGLEVGSTIINPEQSSADSNKVSSPKGE